MGISERCVTILVVVFFFVAVVAFGASVIGIIVSGNNEKTTTAACPIPPILASFSVQKSVFSIWHWKYVDQVSQNSEFALQQACPSVNHDVLLYQNGLLSARLDGEIITDTEKTTMYDCQGNALFIIQTGGIVQTIINSNRISTVYQVQSVNGTLLYYVDATAFIDTTVLFRAPNGDQIAIMTKSITTFPWTWDIIINNPSVTDARIFALLAAKTSFSEGGVDKNGQHEDTTDVCNNYFFWTGLFTLLVFLILVVLLCIFLYVTFKESLADCCNKEHNFMNMRIQR